MKCIRHFKFVWITLYALFLCSCTLSQKPIFLPGNADDKSGAIINDGAYPSPANILNPPYPSPLKLGDSGPYPSVNDSKNSFSETSNSPLFIIHEPVYEGSNQVTGLGPANVPIILIDVSEMGVVLGETVINSNGDFSFQLNEPLHKSHAIGLQIGDLSGTQYRYDDFIYGDYYFDRPLIGIILDMVTVVESK